MKTIVNVLLRRATEKTNKRGLAPISCRITVAGDRRVLSTGIRVVESDWSYLRQKVVGTSPAARTANAALVKMLDQLTDIHADLERQGKPVTAGAISRTYRADGVVLTLLELFSTFREERAGLVGVEIAPATVKSSATCYNRLKDFLVAHRLTDLRPEEFNYSLADKLLHWLLKERGFKRNSANKIIQRISQALRWGVRREYIRKNPLDSYQLKATPPNEIKFLSVAELDVLTHCPVPDVGLEYVRDCFVLQCWTGLAYADLLALNVLRDAEYHTDKQGIMRRVLRITRAKSTMQHGYECVIPLLPEAERLLAKYSDRMPVFTNQAYNRCLKEIGQLCGLSADKMTSHVGRKTAGTLLLNKGVPLPVVSKFLGHANTNITEKLYAKLLDTTVVDAFGSAFGGAGIDSAPPPAYELTA